MIPLQRPDHGQDHTGNFAAYLRVSTDKQDVKTQEHGIKSFLNGGDYKLKWFKEQGVSAGTDWHQRAELHKCLDYCRKNNATLIIYSVSRVSRRIWETLRFFEQEIVPGKIKLIVVDDPTLDHKTIAFKAMFAEYEREQIRSRTKTALGRIQKEIKEKGSYVTKSGRTITKLGVHDKLAEASKAGNKANADSAVERTEEIRPILEGLRDRGLSLRGIARQLNIMQVPTPTKRRNPDLSKRTEWHASSVRNYLKRIEENDND